MNRLLIEFFWLIAFMILTAFGWRVIANRVPALKQVINGRVQLVGMGILFSCAFLWALYPFNELNIWLALSIIALLISGLADDVWDTSVALRLFIQLLTSIVLLFFDLQFPAFVLILMSMTWMNMFNFMDGSNGIMGLTALVTTSFIGVLSMMANGSVFVYPLLIALVVFGWGNFRNKASWISGDTGSVVLGFGSLYIFLMAVRDMDMVTQVCILLSTFSVFLTESGLTLFQRLWRRENILKRHQQHIYQRLVYAAGFKHMHVALIYAFLQLIVCIVLVTLINSSVLLTTVTIGIFAVLTICWVYLNNKLPNNPNYQ